MLSRRDWLQMMTLGTAGVMFGEPISWAEAADTPPRASPPLGPLNRFPRMAQEHFVAQVRAIEEASNKARADLKTKADAEAYLQRVREKIRAAFGPFPEKTPLNARVTGTVERKGYKIEKVIFESRPDFPVTANLYLPTDGKGPGPASSARVDIRTMARLRTPTSPSVRAW